MTKAIEIENLFKEFLKQFAPHTQWTSLIKYTRYNGKVISKNQKIKITDNVYIYSNGIDINKNNNQYILITRTIDEGYEKINSMISFINDINNNITFQNAVVNTFLSDVDNICDYYDDEYHYNILKELLKKEKFSWDVVK